jgi:hypothetical protein
MCSGACGVQVSVVDRNRRRAAARGGLEVGVGGPGIWNERWHKKSRNAGRFRDAVKVR